MSDHATQNATRSRHDAGKLAARLNSLTLGMRRETDLSPPHLADAVARHEASLYDAYRPEGSHQRWLLNQAADAAARLDHCQILIRAQIDDMADRADLCWEEDQERAVEEIASRLSKNPGRVARRLRQTAQGCRWLLARWDALGVPLAENTPWDETQCNLAATLMGVGPDLRASYPELSPETDPATLSNLLTAEADAIQRLMVEALEPLNAKERELARLGYALHPSKELVRLQRLEFRLRKVWNESIAAFRLARAEGFHGPEPLTALAASPAADSSPTFLHVPEPDSADLEPTDEFDDMPEMSMLAALIKTIQATQTPAPDPAPAPPAPSISTAPPKPSTPLNRKARRAQAKAARQAKALSR